MRLFVCIEMQFLLNDFPIISVKLIGNSPYRYTTYWYIGNAIIMFTACEVHLLSLQSSDVLFGSSVEILDYYSNWCCKNN